MLLNKDKDNRPTIFEVAKLPCVYQKIEEYIEKYNCKEEVMQFFDIDNFEQEKVQQKKTNKKTEG
jgi:hypothetical protein